MRLAPALAAGNAYRALPRVRRDTPANSSGGLYLLTPIHRKVPITFVRIDSILLSGA